MRTIGSVSEHDGTASVHESSYSGDVEEGRSIEHLSEVVKILEGSLRHDPRQSLDYALLLAEKLERGGEARQASLLRSILAKAPAQAVARASNLPPVDEDSRIATVDVSAPTDGSHEVVLPPYTQDQVERFAQSVLAFDRLQARGLSAPNRLLLHGPPGTGKTTIARVLAARFELPLVTTRSDALVSSLLGQTSRNIREVFDYAARSPCVLFLDEFDALAKNRADSHEIGELQRVVIALLENIDASGDSTVLIAATNHSQLLDPAVWRRFPHKIQTELPGQEERASLWRSYIGDFALTEKDVRRLAAASSGLSPAAIESAAIDIARDAVLHGGDTIELPRAFRRLARFMRYEEFELFNDEANEIRYLRSWAPDVFTMRVLASTFRTSTRRVGAIITGEQNARPESDPAPSVQSE